MRYISASHARQKFQEVADSVYYTKDPIVVAKHGKPWVKVVPVTNDDLESIPQVTEKEIT